MRRTLVTLSALALAAVGTLPVAANLKGGSRVEKLRLGTYWFGVDVKHDDLIGKVVLVELWGS